MKLSIKLIAASIPFIAIGCQAEKLAPSQEEEEIYQIQAFNGETQAKTVLSDDKSDVLWSPGDEISVHFNGSMVKFTSLNSEPASWTVFQSSTALIYAGTEGASKPYIYGIYPYSSFNSQYKDSLFLLVPPAQEAIAGSFGEGCFPSVGRSVNTEMPFYNVCGGLRFSVSQAGINRVVFHGNNYESLAGGTILTFDENNHPKVARVIESEGDNQVMLYATDSTGFEVGQWYYISMLPACLDKGYTIKLYKGSDVAQLKEDGPKEIKRSLFGQLSDIDRGTTFKSAISKLTLSQKELFLSPMATARLYYTVYPENAEYEWVKWESSYEQVAKVDENGIVTAVNSGSCVIYAHSDNGESAVCFVYVGEPAIYLNLTELSIDSGKCSTEISLLSNRDWKVVDIPDWISINPASGKASTEAQTITLDVATNTGTDRTANITFSTGSKTATLTVKQAGIQVKGDGSKENPFNVAQAIERAQEIGQEAPSTEYYYFKGYITSIKEVSTSYGNASFYIGDSKEATSDLFYCFQVKNVGQTSFTSADQINVGDEVVMCGQIYNYRGNTPETSGKGASYIYTLNGQGGGEEPDPTKAEAKTVQEFISAADKTTYYKLTGTVSGFSSKYCSFDLTDATGTIYVYSVAEESKTQYASIIKDGGTITISGKYDYYAAKSQHEVVSAVILDFKEGKQQDPAKAESKTVAEFLSLKDAITYYKLEGTISNFNSSFCSFDLTDATGTINVYSVEDTCKTKYASILQDGFKVTVSGKYKNYQGTEEVVNAVILGYEGSDSLSINYKHTK